MKRHHTLAICVLVFIVAIYLTGFNSRTSSSSQAVSTTYIKGIDAIQSSIKGIQEGIETEKDLEILRKEFIQARLHYKSIEFLAAYLHPEFISDFINGAPLPKLERGSDQVKEIDPIGFQIMEETLFSEDAQAHMKEILEYANLLQTYLNDLEKFNTKRIIQDFQIFHAARQELVRIYAQGLTGYDTPMSGNSLEENRIALAAISKAMEQYYSKLSHDAPAVQKNLQDLFYGANEFMQSNTDFDSFDRLTFLVDYINPLYKTLLKAQRALSIEYPHETVPIGLKFSTNYFSENIYDSDYINPFYYSDLLEHQYSDDLVNLGRTLFFDPILSSSNERACASCHIPEKAFTDGLDKSIAMGYDGTVDRNAPTLLNAIYADRYFYDMRSKKLEEQIEHVIFNQKEFDTSILKILEKLKKSPEYVQLFEKAFPDMGEYTFVKHTLGTSISAYIISLKKYNSPFDQYVRGETDQIDPLVREGHNLFMGKAVCGTCHFAPTFSGLIPPYFEENESEVLGVPKSIENVQIDPDLGRSTGLVLERNHIYDHSFKTVTVRNTEHTGPYMHNGIYKTLEEVVDFYNKGGGVGLGFDIPNQTLPFDSLSLTGHEQKALVAFMKSLSDDPQSYQNERPDRLPEFPEETGLNDRKIGGDY